VLWQIYRPEKHQTRSMVSEVAVAELNTHILYPIISFSHCQAWSLELGACNWSQIFAVCALSGQQRSGISCCPVQAGVSFHCSYNWYATIPCWEHRDLYYSGLYPQRPTSDPRSIDSNTNSGCQWIRDQWPVRPLRRHTRIEPSQNSVSHKSHRSQSSNQISSQPSTRVLRPLIDLVRNKSTKITTQGSVLVHSTKTDYCRCDVLQPEVVPANLSFWFRN